MGGEHTKNGEISNRIWYKVPHEGMKIIASLELSRAGELLTSLKNAQIAVEVQSTQHPSGLKTSEILVANEDFQRGCDLVETWYVEQRVLKKNQLSIRIVVVAFLCVGLATLISPPLGMIGFLLMMDSTFVCVIWKALRTGVIHSRPLAEWTDDVEKFKNPFGFWLRVVFCILMCVGLSYFIFLAIAYL